MPGQLRLVDHHLRVEYARIHIGITRLQFDIADRRFDRRAVERPLHGQLDLRRRIGHAHHRPRGRRAAQRQHLGLDAMQNVHDATVLQPGLIIEETPQLLRKLSHSALCVFTGLQPVVVHATGTRIGFELGHRRQGQHPLQQGRQLFLPAARHQEIPEGAETSSLIGIGNRIALAHDLLQQRAFRAFPQRDAFAHAAIQSAKVVLDLAKIGKQFTRQLHELLEAVFQRRAIEHRHVTGNNAGDLGVDLVAALVQLGNAQLRVGLAALAHLLEQFEQRQQARLGADKAALSQRSQPGDRLLGRRRQVEMRLIRTMRVELAQPALFGRGPVVEVIERRFREGLGADALAQREQFVFKRLRQIRLHQRPHVGYNKHALQETGDQRRMIRTQQPPGRVALAQQVKGGVVEAHTSSSIPTSID